MGLRWLFLKIMGMTFSSPEKSFSCQRKWGNPAFKLRVFTKGNNAAISAPYQTYLFPRQAKTLYNLGHMKVRLIFMHTRLF
jgi:hypothetical protein